MPLKKHFSIQERCAAIHRSTTCCQICRRQTSWIQDNRRNTPIHVILHLLMAAVLSRRPRINLTSLPRLIHPLLRPRMQSISEDLQTLPTAVNNELIPRTRLRALEQLIQGIKVPPQSIMGLGECLLPHLLNSQLPALTVLLHPERHRFLLALRHLSQLVANYPL